MEKDKKAEALKEWAVVLKEHPKFAKAFLAQQAIMMEASELGDSLIVSRMCKLIELGFFIPFLGYWEERCKKLKPIRIEDTDSIFACLASANDPADCFSLPHEDEWFNDPFVGGRFLPPKPPIPPLTK